MNLRPQSPVIKRLGISVLSCIRCRHRSMLLCFFIAPSPLPPVPRTCALVSPEAVRATQAIWERDAKLDGTEMYVWVGTRTARTLIRLIFLVRYTAVEVNVGSGVLQCPSAVDWFTRVPYNDTWSTATCRAMQCATAYTEVTGVAAGTPCVFPFREGGVLRHSCVSDDPWGTPAFCATAV